LGYHFLFGFICGNLNLPQKPKKAYPSYGIGLLISSAKTKVIPIPSAEEMIRMMYEGSWSWIHGLNLSMLKSFSNSYLQ